MRSLYPTLRYTAPLPVPSSVAALFPYPMAELSVPYGGAVPYPMAEL